MTTSMIDLKKVRKEMSNYKDTALKICSSIVDAASKLNDMQKYALAFAIDIYLDGESYNAVVVDPDRKHYDIGSRPEDYVGDSELEYAVQIEDLAFPCKNFSISNGIAMFECMDPMDAAIIRCISFGKIADQIQAAGVENISKVVVKMTYSGSKHEVAGVQDCEYCDITSEKFGNQKALVLSYVELDKVLDLSYTSTIEKIAQDEYDNDVQFAESMDSLGTRYYGMHEDEATDIIQPRYSTFTIQFLTDKAIGQTNRYDVDAANVEDAMFSFIEAMPEAFPGQNAIEVVSISQDGKKLPKHIVDAMNKQHFAEFNECDAGGAGGDAGAAAGGDAGTGTAGAGIGDVGDAAAEIVGTTTADVLGKCEPGKGYMGKDNFYIPAKAQVALHRWEAANGGSKRKKKGKYPYEKGMKVVVSMFEDDEGLDESALDVAKIYFKEFSQPEIVNNISNIYQAIQWLDDWRNTAEPEGDFPEVAKIIVNGKLYTKNDIDTIEQEMEDERAKEYNRSHIS